MDFQEHQINQAIHIEDYGADFIQINQQVYRQSIIVGDDVQVIENKQLNLNDLIAENFEPAVYAGADVILLGTGAKHRFIHPKIIAELSSKGVSLECMSTPAACRTLTLLQSEGRKVWAWLTMDSLE